jgi:hypothetical protein
VSPTGQRITGTMDLYRLDSVAPTVAEYFRRASSAERRRAASIACQEAATAIGLTSDQAREALAALRGSSVSGPALRKRLEGLAADLDDEYLRLNEDDDSARKQEALRRFSMARATSALAFALSEDDGVLHEAIYEALASMEDSSGVLRLIDAVLARPM